MGIRSLWATVSEAVTLPGRNGGSGRQQPTPGDRGPTAHAASPPNSGEYTINLTFEGHLQRHRVTQHMLVNQLAVEAADVSQDSSTSEPSF